MYVEFNESEDSKRDWEIEAEFYPEERKELDYYITATREEQVRTEVPQQTTYEASLEAAWPRKHVHKRVLRPARLKARLRQG